MTTTPTKSENRIPHYTAREIKTPSKDSSGIQSTVYNQSTELHCLFKDWDEIIRKGCVICRKVVDLRPYEDKDDCLLRKLSVLMESLVEAVNSLEDILTEIEVYVRQFNALAKLDKSNAAVINTWNMSKLSQTIQTIYQMYKTEYQLKYTVRDNIAHCVEGDMTELYASSWEFQPYLNRSIINSFLVEMGFNIEDT